MAMHGGFVGAILLLAVALCSQTPVQGHNAGSMPSFASLFTNIAGARQAAYNLKDSEGQQMACLHVVEGSSDPYIGLYQSQVGSEFQVRAAVSHDLFTWTFVRTLLPNADMPFPFTVKENGWIVVAHEQWMNAGSQLPSRLGFKLYYNASMLLAGQYFNSYVAPLSVGRDTQLEGTPSIYSADLVMRHGLYMLDLAMGFHFNDPQHVDQVAQGQLTSFGPTVVSPQWAPSLDTAYDDVFIRLGAIGNIGQRGNGALQGQRFLVQEANIGKMPPTIWQDWRVWLYVLAPTEPLPPTGAGTAYQLSPVTPGNSTAFGNPAIAVVPCPSAVRAGAGAGMCMYTTYFIFSQGAGPGEAGPVAFLNPLPAL